MTTATEYDPYSLSSGLIDDFDATISEAYFGYDEKYNDGSTVLLILECTTDDLDRPTETLKLSTGTGWVIENQGRNIVSENGKPRSFNKNSVVGGFLASALNVGAGELMRSKGTPMEAATWRGLSFHFNRVMVAGFDGSEKERLLPTAFIGGGAVPASTNTAAPTASTAEVSAATRGKLTALVRSTADRDAFMDSAFNTPEFANDQAAIELILDEGFYAEARG